MRNAKDDFQGNNNGSQTITNEGMDKCLNNWQHPSNNKRHSDSRALENVIVLQGGGSLGAFACGAFKAMVKEGIKIDIASGTSVGAINAAIIAGSKSDHPERSRELLVRACREQL